jgi:hypothetical protein
VEDPAVDRPRRYYGIAEVADALGLNRQLVTVWRRRRSRGMPEPDDELASGPLWRGATIEPWIAATRARLAAEAAGAAVPLGPADARRWARRLLRLVALLLEDTLRPALVARALRELDQAAAGLAAAAPSPERDALLATATRIAAAGDPGSGLLAAALAGIEPAVRAVLATGEPPEQQVSGPDGDG